MLDARVCELLNNQVNKELYSAYLYLDFSIFYADNGLDGFANWYMIQAQEERDHAMLFLQYMQNNGCSVNLEVIDKPDKTLNALNDPLKEGLTHERYVTELIHTIYDVANDVKDFRTMQFLDWLLRNRAKRKPMPKGL